MIKDNSTRQAIILGALLHDIGKFAHRAGVELNEEDKKLVEICCPKNAPSIPTHIHAVLSGRFTRDFLGKNWAEVENRTLYHHRPAKIEDKIVQLADWLSCGERRDKGQEEFVAEVKKEPLINIFSQMEINGVKISEHYCPVRYLNNILEDLFPLPAKEKALSQNPNDENSFQYQWKKFCEETKLIIKDNPSIDILLLRLLYLLEKYTLFIPSSAYRDKPEISLYHHLKSTAAIATCLYDLNISEEKIDKIISAYQYKDEEILQQNDFLLVSGDISGIQDFIYSVTSEHALKGLRGRSFYLQLLSETIAKSILDEFNLYLCNLLYCGGGHFLILLPNLQDSHKRLDDLYKKLNQNLFYAHHGKIAVVIAYSPLGYKDFLGDNLATVLKNLSELSAREKKRKFSNIIDQQFFEYGVGGEYRGCEICGEELDGNGKRCRLCESFEELSKKIKDAKYMEIEKNGSVSHIKKEEKVYDWKHLLKSFGYDYRFVTEKSSWKLTFKLNDTDFLSECLVGYRFEAFHSPEGTLEDIANKADGIKKWSALRMDVDNLGDIFDVGLKNKTISRMNMLSYSISLFFSIRIRYIVEQPEYKDKAVIVYSGGDDLFIIGAWSILPEIAQKIYTDFRNFTCNHPKITLSGGIYLAPSKKFPVYQAAEEAGRVEHMAKTAKENKKDKITFFDAPLKWNELEELEKIKNKIVQLLNGETSDKKMPRSLLTILYSSYEDQKLAEKNKISIGRIWRFLYGLKRLAERYYKKEEEREKLLELRDTFMVNTKLKQNLDIAVRWAEYLRRKEEK